MFHVQHDQLTAKAGVISECQRTSFQPQVQASCVCGHSSNYCCCSNTQHFPITISAILMSRSTAPPLCQLVMLNMKHMRVASPYPSHANIGVRDGGAGFSRSVRYVQSRRRRKSGHFMVHEKKRNPGSNETAYARVGAKPSSKTCSP